jgi:DHA2 family multidrug resistance protein
VFADPVHGQAGALRTLWSLTYREAQVQTYADAFVAIGVGFAVATAMVLLMRKTKPAAAPSADAH